MLRRRVPGSRFKLGGLGVGRLPNVVALCPPSVRQASASVRKCSHERPQASASVRKRPQASASGVMRAVKEELHRTRAAVAFHVAFRGVPNPSS